MTNTERSTKVAKELFADYMKEKKLREPEEKKELAQTLKTFNVKARKKKICSMYNKTIISFGFCDIQKNQVLSNGTPTSTLIILDITKTECKMYVFKVCVNSFFSSGSLSFFSFT